MITKKKKILAAAPVNAGGSKIAAVVEDDYDAQSAKAMMQQLMSVPNVVAAIIYHSGERVNYMFGLSDNAVGDCKKIVTAANEIFGGRGGGKKDSAQGGAPYEADHFLINAICHKKFGPVLFFATSTGSKVFWGKVFKS